jgi:hypothetical protein
MHTTEMAKPPTPSGISNLASGLVWVQQQLTANKVTNASPHLKEYSELVPKLALRVASEDLREVVEGRLAFNLIYSPYPKNLCEWCKLVWEHIGGLVLSISLLSLGAPFWFNLLSKMSNLRPFLAVKDSIAPKTG